MTNPFDREAAVFSAVRLLPARERAAQLDEACAGDTALRQRVEELLSCGEEAAGFLQEAPSGAQRPADAIAPAISLRRPPSPGEKPGDFVGRYKLLELIGQGGCGSVYRAKQEEPVRREVALKVIKLGMDTKEVIARFEAERQALALMDHPNIAKIYDAGATEGPLGAPASSPASSVRVCTGEDAGAPRGPTHYGRPYFVMELVRGTRITDYCAENNLSIEERLNLFTQVCEAIQHAHQKGVIHRDIKPSNILVTLTKPGGTGCPKVIDFGIAKATTGQHLTDKTVFTPFEQFIGTPAYMSPEQAMMTSPDIDTRTDIYSLGVLLYELLTGRPPFDSKELLAAGLDEMRRTIREVEPPKPSTQLKAKAEGRKQKAEIELLPSDRLAAWESKIENDLDWIVMKALEKDRERRYETANGLARDVQHYLADEPVVARPPSKLYRLQKLVRRNKLAFAAAGAVLAALVVGLAAATWEYHKEREAEKAATVMNKFLTQSLLFQAGPEQNAREKKLTLEEALQVAERALVHDPEIAAQPKLEATLRLDFGTTFKELGALDEAERNLRHAFDLRRSVLGAQHLDTLDAEYELAEFLEDYLRKYGEAEPLFQETWTGRLKLLGAEHPDTLLSLEGLEDVMYSTGRTVEAEQMARQILAIRERRWGRDAYKTIDALRNVAAVVGARGDHAQAERLMREALSRHQRTGTNQELYFLLVKNVAVERLLQGDPQEATKRLTEAVPQMAQHFGADHPRTLLLQRVLARALADQGTLAEAETLAQTTLDARRRKTSDPEGTGRTLLVLGRVLVQLGKLDEAEPHLQEALTIFREHVPMKKDALATQAANWLGAIQVARTNLSEAEGLLLPDSDQFFDSAAQMSPNELRLALGHIVALYQVEGKHEQEALWQEKLDALPQSARSQ